jgi:hypothetical protein
MVTVLYVIGYVSLSNLLHGPKLMEKGSHRYGERHQANSGRRDLLCKFGPGIFQGKLRPLGIWLHRTTDAPIDSDCGHDKSALAVSSRCGSRAGDLQLI